MMEKSFVEATRGGGNWKHPKQNIIDGTLKLDDYSFNEHSFSLDTYHTSLTQVFGEANGGKDDTTLHNKKYHAKKQFIISFSQVFSISLSFKTSVEY